MTGPTDLQTALGDIWDAVWAFLVVPQNAGAVVAITAVLTALFAFVALPIWRRRSKVDAANDAAAQTKALADEAIAALKENRARDRAEIESLRSEKDDLEAAIRALQEEAAERPSTRETIDAALKASAEGDTTRAEAMLQAIEDRHTAAGPAEYAEAAAAARHRGALAFLHDTQTALAAYRRATEWAPDEPGGWNQLGQLLKRVGDLADAEAAFNRVAAIGAARDDKRLEAVAFGNLGVIAQTRGDLDAAEDFYKKSLALNEALGRKEGMANQYGNLGGIALTRGDLPAAEAYWRKSLALYEQIGAAPMIERVQGWLDDLPKP